MSRMDNLETHQRDDFWLQKVEQLMREKKKDKAVIKQQNQRILEANG